MTRPRSRAYPNRGTITIADGETYPINVSGNFINVKTADQSFTIVLDGTDELKAAQNRRFKLTQEDSFKKVDIVNDSGNALTFQVEIGYGGIESDDVTLTGDVKIVNGDAPNDELQIKTKAGTELEINSADIENKLDSVITMLQNDTEQRSGLTTLEGASFASVANSTSTVVSAGANTNGVIIRHFQLHLPGVTGSHGWLKVNGNFLFSSGQRADGDRFKSYKDFYVPSGQSIQISATGASTDNAYLWYELL